MHGTKFFSTLLLAQVFVTSASAVTFNFTGKAGTPASIVTHFEAAGDVWEAVLEDNITINVNVGYVPMSDGVLGGNLSSYSSFNYANSKAALEAQTGFQSTGITLPSGSSFDKLINLTKDKPGATVWHDDDGDANNMTIRWPRANAKAAGLIAGTATAVDCDIEFNNKFNWDFDDANGIPTNFYSFRTVAVHELGHCLGTSSGVDDLIFRAKLYFDDRYVYVSPMDLIRRSVKSRTEHGVNTIDFTADTRAKLAIWASRNRDGGFSTGGRYGDGHQASHWKDNVLMGLADPIGIMDPNVDAGIARTITPLDLRLLRSIGYETSNSSNLTAANSQTGQRQVAEANTRSDKVKAKFSVTNPRFTNPEDQSVTGILYEDCWYTSYVPETQKNGGEKTFKLESDECENLFSDLENSGDQQRMNAVEVLSDEEIDKLIAQQTRSHGAESLIEIPGEIPGEEARSIIAPSGIIDIEDTENQSSRPILDLLKTFESLNIRER